MEPQYSPEQRETLIAQLKEPFHPRDVHWRVLRKQKNNDRRGEVVAYVKSAVYRDRLTKLFTTAGWTSRCDTAMFPNLTRDKGSAKVNTGKLMVTCTITIHGIGTHSSTGEEWADEDNALTTAEAQAFKRTCAFFGLGDYISKIEKPWVDLDQYGNIVDKNGKKYSPPLPNWALPAKYLEDYGPQMPQQDVRQQQAPQQQQSPAASVATSTPARQANRPPQQDQPHTSSTSNGHQTQQAHSKEELELIFGTLKSQLGMALFNSIVTMVREGFEHGRYNGDKNNTTIEFMNRAVQTIQNIREMAAEVGDSVFVSNMDKLKIRSLNEMQSVSDLTGLKLAMEKSLKALASKAA
jgi:hypothetical protein